MSAGWKWFGGDTSGAFVFYLLPATPEYIRRIVYVYTCGHDQVSLRRAVGWLLQTCALLMGWPYAVRHPGTGTVVPGVIWDTTIVRYLPNIYSAGMKHC